MPFRVKMNHETDHVAVNDEGYQSACDARRGRSTAKLSQRDEIACGSTYSCRDDLKLVKGLVRVLSTLFRAKWSRQSLHVAVDEEGYQNGSRGVSFTGNATTLSIARRIGVMTFSYYPRDFFKDFEYCSTRKTAVLPCTSPPMRELHDRSLVGACP